MRRMPQMRQHHCLLAFLGLCACFVGLPRASASIWADPEPISIESPSKRFVFWLNPDGKYPERYGQCRGRLLERIGDQWQLKWERYLANNWAPLRIVVSDDGHVATIGEWGESTHYPTPFLLALYAPDGQIMQIHTWEGLGLDEDRERVRYAWWDYMIPFFEGKTLYLHFHWGRLIAIETRFGYQVEADDAEWPDVMKKGRDRLRLMISGLLQSENWRIRVSGVMAAQHLQFRDAIPQLRILLNDPHQREARDEWWFYVRAMAKEALESMDEEVGDVQLEVEKHVP